MAVFKYRMAAKLVAIFDCMLALLPLIALMPTLVVSAIGFRKSLPALHGKTLVILVISTTYSVMSLCFAVALLKSTKSRYPQQHVCAVTAWVVYKIVQLAIAAILAIVYIFWFFQKNQSLIAAAIMALGLFPVAFVGCIPLYFVNKYRIELRSYVNEYNNGVEDTL